MPKEKDKTAPTMTDLLRTSLENCDSLRAVARATGTQHQALMRFRNGTQSLRLDLADRLAAHFGIESRHKGK